MPHRIIIVGGGIGGTMTANHLATKLYPEIRSGKVEILMLSNSPWHYYKPAFMYIAFDSFFKNELRRPQRSLLRPEIDFLIEEVEEFQYNQNRVKCKSGKVYGYDQLVISTGCVPSPERIDGLKEGGDHFYQYEPARQLADKLKSIEKGRILVTVTFPKTPNVPHQCGIAPIETTLMLDDLLRKRGVRDKVEIVYTYPTVAQLLRNCLFLQKDTCEVLPSIFEQR
ncbi:NAD(P)/FAD-dependent oxidoreductase, partial [Salmonella enterica subsp. enterica serovar Enteritidis]|nr:NAD(P)/FAD-dependent oxidoreductase [Salmonella enterica subsp. enterica serovar Enteritidis]